MKKLDRFTIEETLSTGTVTAYKAVEQLPGDVTRPVTLRTHAIKDQATMNRFVNEVRVLAALGTERHVATVYAMGVTDNIAWVASEYLPTTVVSLCGDAPGKPDDVLRVLTDVLEGLNALHSSNPPVLHLDIKPSNIQIDRHGRCRLANFTMASAVSDDPVYAADSARYTPPEVLNKDFGPKSPSSDLYALGHVAYEIALGARQYRNAMPAVFEGVSTKEITGPSRYMQWHCSISTRATDITEMRKDFPPALASVIARLMAKSPKERYATAAEVLADLKTATAPATAPTPVAEAAAPVAPAAVPQRVAPSVAPPRFTRTAPPPPPAAAGTAPGDAGQTGSRYYVRLRGRQTGPFDLVTLQRQVKQGLVSRLHQVSTDGITWRAATTIEGLF